MTRDPGHAAGDQTYPPPAPPCGCGHQMLVHAIGTRAGVRARTACSTSGCGCRIYHPADPASAGPGPVDLDLVFARYAALSAVLEVVPGSVLTGPAAALASDVPRLVAEVRQLRAVADRGRYWPTKEDPL